jgi:hypothetical protein
VRKQPRTARSTTRTKPRTRSNRSPPSRRPPLPLREPFLDRHSLNDIERLISVEAPGVERADTVAAEHLLGQSLTDGGRAHEAVALPARCEEEALVPGKRTRERVAVRRRRTESRPRPLDRERGAERPLLVAGTGLDEPVVRLEVPAVRVPPDRLGAVTAEQAVAVWPEMTSSPS